MAAELVRRSTRTRSRPQSYAEEQAAEEEAAAATSKKRKRNASLEDDDTPNDTIKVEAKPQAQRKTAKKNNAVKPEPSSGSEDQNDADFHLSSTPAPPTPPPAQSQKSNTSQKPSAEVQQILSEEPKVFLHPYLHVEKRRNPHGALYLPNGDTIHHTANYEAEIKSGGPRASFKMCRSYCIRLPRSRGRIRMVSMRIAWAVPAWCEVRS
jgi:hypothetical protein